MYFDKGMHTRARGEVVDKVTEVHAWECEFRSPEEMWTPDGVAGICNPKAPTARWKADTGDSREANMPASLANKTCLKQGGRPELTAAAL